MSIVKKLLSSLVVFIIIPANLSGCGPRGAAGVNGLSIIGAAGANGQDGQGCQVTAVASSPVAPNGGSLISCPATSSLVLNGTNGTAGAAGSPGTVITSIQLCPGVPVYPSKFIEVAFCMNEQLYGVYSANGGFITLLPPGAYASNGINSSCNFTIGNNCSVAH